MKKTKTFYECDNHVLIKTFRIMRITFFLLLVSILQTLANDTYSQVTKLSLDISATKLVDVLDEIEEQSEFYFLFNEKLINTNREVSINVKNEKINEIWHLLIYLNPMPNKNLYPEPLQTKPASHCLVLRY